MIIKQWTLTNNIKIIIVHQLIQLIITKQWMRWLDIINGKIYICTSTKWQNYIMVTGTRKITDSLKNNNETENN